MKNLVLLFVLSIAVSCTKNKTESAKPSEKFVKYSSAVKYKFEKIKDMSQAAIVDETGVSWSQLLSNDVALQELQTTYYNRGLGFAYAWAQMLGEGGSAVDLTVFMPQPKGELADILQLSLLVPAENVKVSYSEASDHEILASVNGKSLSWAEFHNANVQHSRLYERLFTQRMQRLNGIVVRRYILQASKEADIGMEEFVKSKILSGPANPTDDDVKAFAKEKGIAESDLNENMILRLKEIIKQNDRDQKIEEYVAENLIKKPILVAFDSPKMKVKTPEISEAMPQWGQKGPELVFVGHWSCKNCDSTLKSFLKTRESFKNVLQGAFIYSFPERDREARMGAEAALCVQSQNQDSFWTFLNKIMDVVDENVEEKINTAAQNSGIDYDQFRDCFLKRQHQQVVDTHLAYAKNLGVTSAPLMIFQGDVLDLPLDPGVISSKVSELGLVTAKKKGFFARMKAFFGF